MKIKTIILFLFGLMSMVNGQVLTLDKGFIKVYGTTDILYIKGGLQQKDSNTTQDPDISNLGKIIVVGDLTGLNPSKIFYKKLHFSQTGKVEIQNPGGNVTITCKDDLIANLTVGNCNLVTISQVVHCIGYLRFTGGKIDVTAPYLSLCLNDAGTMYHGTLTETENNYVYGNLIHALKSGNSFNNMGIAFESGDDTCSIYRFHQPPPQPVAEHAHKIWYRFNRKLTLTNLSVRIFNHNKVAGSKKPAFYTNEGGRMIRLGGILKGDSLLTLAGPVDVDSLFIADSMCIKAPISFTVNGLPATDYHACDKVPYLLGIDNTLSMYDYFVWKRNEIDLKERFSYNDAANTSDIINYNITANTISGCTAPFNFTVYGEPIPSFLLTSMSGYACTNRLYQLEATNATNMTGFQWEVEDSVYNTANPKHLFKTLGNATIKLTGSNAYCSISNERNTEVNNRYIPSTTIIDEACDSAFIGTFRLDINNIIDHYELDFKNSGSKIRYDRDKFESLIKFNYGVPDTFEYKQYTYDANTCSDTTKYNVIVYPAINNSISYNHSCASEIIFKPNESNRKNLNYTWDLGYGLPITNYGDSVKGVYPAPGEYNVKATIKNHTNTCTFPEMSPIKVTSPGKVQILSSGHCKDQPILFTTTGSDIKTCIWHFSDNTSDTGIIVSKIFTTTGKFYVNVEIEQLSTNCYIFSKDSVTIDPVPTAAFSANTVCEKDTTAFTNLSTGETKYEWTFGDGAVDSVPNPEHRFILSNTYNTRLVVSNNYQCTDTAFQSVTVNPLPPLNFAYDTSKTCSDSLTLNAGAGSTYLWNTGAITPSLVVKTENQYYVTVHNAFGCVKSDTTYVLLNQTFTIDLGKDTAVCGGTFLDAGSFDVDYLWSTGETTSKIYTSLQGTNTYTVHGQSNTDALCEAFDTIVVTVNPLPNIQFANPIVSCADQPVILDAASFQLSVPFASYQWTNASTQSSLTISASGTYGVRVTDINGCQGGDTTLITIKPLPVIFPLPKSITGCNEVTLDAGNDGTSYSWNNGSVVRLIKAITSGYYQVNVTKNGCVDSAGVHVTIYRYDPLILPSDTVICENETLTLDAGSSDCEYRWNDGSTEREKIISAPGTYGVKSTYLNGCTDTATVRVATLVMPKKFLGNDRIICENSTTILSVNAYTCRWGSDFGLNASQTSLTVTAPGSYYAHITDIHGCKSSDTIVMLKQSVPVVAQFLVPSEITAEQSFYVRNLSYQDPLRHRWNFGYNDNIPETDPLFSYAVSGEKTITLNVTNDECAAQMVKNVTILPLLKTKPIEEKRDEDGNLIVTIEESSLYPNPNNGEFTIDVKLNRESDLYVFIYDLNGQPYYMHMFPEVKENKIHLSMPIAYSGFYFVRMIAGTSSFIHKFIIVK